VSLLIGGLATLNQILVAGISITAFSLLLYALTFNLRERVARSFAALLGFVTIVYFCDAVLSTLAAAPPESTQAWLRLQWIGIAFIPVTYLHFSDALLALTGRPSRGRRRAAIRILYAVAIVFLVAAAFTDVLVRDGLIESGAAHLRAGPLFVVFVAYFGGSLAWAGWNFVRAYRRCQTPTTRRRMIYLIVSAAAPPLGTFPFLLVAGRTAALHPLLFWTLLFTVNAAVAALLVALAYTVAYFGVTQTDRVVKGRLFQWLLRGPVVASTVLAVYVLVNRIGSRLPNYDARVQPFVVVSALLLLQFLITLFRVPIERVLFYGADRPDLRRLQLLEERLLTSGDLAQFLESVLAGLCDTLRISSAFIAALGEDGKLDYEVTLGPDAPTRAQTELPPFTALRAAQVRIVPADDGGGPDGNPASAGAAAPAINPGPAAVGPISLDIFEWGQFWIIPLRRPTSAEPLGLLGLKARAAPVALSADEAAALKVLAARAAAALEDRRLQQDVFRALDRLLPQIDALQRLRASAAYSSAKALTAADSVVTDPDLAQFIKDALTHYWGGPKLTHSPLLRLRIVERALRDHDGNPANALRAVLQEAIERLKPEGQRKFTAEWLLYNIMEMKFLQGRRVRDVAMRLAVSEADLYRKQRVALEEVASAIREMEREAAERATGYEIAG
jgi:hypothetical protein